MNSLLEKLLRVGFLTGSRAFGGFTDESDWDIVHSIEDTALVASIIGNLPHEQSAYFSGYYIEYEGVKINIIPVHPHEFLPWYLATEAFKATWLKSRIPGAIKKYAAFGALINMFRGLVEERGGVDGYLEIKRAIVEGRF